MTLLSGGGELNGKRLELLKLAAPSTKRVAIVGHDLPHASAHVGPRSRKAAAMLSIELATYSFFSSLERLEPMFAAMARDGIDAAIITELPATNLLPVQKEIHRLAEKHRIPVIHEVLTAVESGGLMAYGHDINKLYLRSAYYVDRILRGAKPGDMPIEQPADYELRVNLKAAKAIGLSIPQSLLVQASRVVGTAAAQRVPKVAIVLNTAELAEVTKIPPGRPLARAFYESMKERGWIHGRNVELVWRSAEQHPERFPAIMEELVRMKVDVIVVSGNRAAREALEKTKTIPIVLGTSEFAAETGLVKSYARPGGNVTGVSMMVSHLDAKRIGILKELDPRVTRVAVMGYVNAPSGPLTGRSMQEALKALGLTGIHVRADRGEDIEQAFAEAISQGVNGMIVSSAGPMLQPENQAKIHALAIRHRIPVLHAVLRGAETGGLAAYSADEVAVWHRAGHYVDRILRGEKPDHMPIEHPTAYHLHLNRKAAAAIGLTIPASVLTQADKVFD